MEIDRSDGYGSYESEQEVFLMRVKVKEKYASRVVSSGRRSFFEFDEYWGSQLLSNDFGIRHEDCERNLYGRDRAASLSSSQTNLPSSGEIFETGSSESLSRKTFLTISAF
ncbi:hypothetical protein BG32_13040 [Mesotoga sp. HF07.pep.5.2.highcov]|nr:hypothetical protein Y696_03380 [Mesotoga sp. H07pep.5.4]RLL90121.1 hypothetical protein BG32_13040 [Mesotoga sp. HF07.pep.5.2.highcov]